MIARFLARLMDSQTTWAQPFGDFNHRWLVALFRPIRPAKDFLNGTWLGHPLHAAITDVPVGLFTGVILLDLLDQRGAADAILVLGILSMAAAAVAGLADYTDTDGAARLRATVHGTIMVSTLVVYLVSLVIRAGNPLDRTAAVIVSLIGYGLITAGAYVGGDVVYVLGNMVSRHAFRGAGTKWIRLELETPSEDLPEGVPTKAKLGINNLVLVRVGETVHALHEQCAHAGGPLSQGTVVDGCIECPWHGSRYRLANGHLARGPSVYDQPRYELRPAEGGGWEARRAPR
ncbi:MAG: Rieske (2Fe-2S) protein [Chloroflexi bacterium]|nr:MAG: Rieske (2Fe-2S) protein [Chloroflexota bacterium]